jgi:hypothetical protein
VEITMRHSSCPDPTPVNLCLLVAAEDARRRERGTGPLPLAQWANPGCEYPFGPAPIEPVRADDNSD